MTFADWLQTVRHIVGIKLFVAAMKIIAQVKAATDCLAAELSPPQLHAFSIGQKPAGIQAASSRGIGGITAFASRIQQLHPQWALLKGTAMKFMHFLDNFV